MEAMVALVLAGTQVANSWIQSWFNVVLAKWHKVVVSLFASVGVVLYTLLKAGDQITADAIFTALAVFALANGAKKLINKVR